MVYSLSLFAGAGWQFFDNNGKILSGGNLYTYAAGTTTPLTTYTSSAATTANTNPIVLDASGRVPYEIWINTTSTAKFALYTSTGTLIGTWDNIPSYASSLNLTGTNNAVTYFNSVGTFTSSSNMTFDGSNLTVAGGITAGSNVAITGNISTTGTATFTGLISSTAGISSSTPAVTQSAGDNSTKIATTAFVANTSAKAKIQPLTVSNISGGGFTLNLAPTTLDFRDITLGSGTVTTITNASTISINITGAATLGTASGKLARIAVLAIYNTTIGTSELAVVNITGGLQLDETNVFSSTTAITSGTSSTVVYSTTARTNVVYRVVGFVDATNTSGSWGSGPTLVQGTGGQPLAALSSIGYGQNWLSSTTTPSITRAAGTTYYNETGKPILVNIKANGTGAADADAYVNGVYAARSFSFPGSSVANLCFVVPPNSSYYLTTILGTISWLELR